jgi:hypothetical protein
MMQNLLFKNSFWPLCAKRAGRTESSDGYILLTVLVMAFLLSTMGMIGAQMLINNSRFNQYQAQSAEALNIAESGVNYYMWHLAHNATDYQDGGSTPTTAPYGPYVHNFYDISGNLLGTYTLYITPPSSGSTIVTIKSVGQVTNFPGTRTILAQVGQPSFANYALLSNAQVWFGSTETSNGPVFSNVGVHFDGVNNGTVSSASTSYTPSSEYGGDGGIENGVWGNGGPKSQWQYPVPSVDFTKVTANLSTLQSDATSGGTSLAPSKALGYYLYLRSDGLIDYYKVTNETSSGITTTPISMGNAAPANGVMFVNDNVWVQGTNWPGRITIASAVLPQNSSTNTNINIIGNLTYASQTGSDAIGLIAQNNVNVSNYAPTTINIDAAVMAVVGNVWAEYPSPVRSTINFFGSIAVSGVWTWNWVDGNNNIVAGYQVTNTSFDSNLVYAPPPQYPTTGSYSILNWREELSGP